MAVFYFDGSEEVINNINEFKDYINSEVTGVNSFSINDDLIKLSTTNSVITENQLITIIGDFSCSGRYPGPDDQIVMCSCRTKALQLTNTVVSSTSYVDIAYFYTRGYKIDGILDSIVVISERNHEGYEVRLLSYDGSGEDVEVELVTVTMGNSDLVNYIDLRSCLLDKVYLVKIQCKLINVEDPDVSIRCIDLQYL